MNRQAIIKRLATLLTASAVMVGLVVLTASAAGAATHFTVPAATDSWADFMGTVKIDGVDAQAGDEIAFFDPQGVLCGLFVVMNPGEFGIVPVYGDDELTPGVDEGAVAGDILSIKVWDASIGIEIPGTSLEFTAGVPPSQSSFLTSTIPPTWQDQEGYVLNIDTASHFTKPAPGPFASSYLGSLTILGQPGEIGDEVAVFDPDGVLCGMARVTTAGQYGVVEVFGDDTVSTPGTDEGALENDPLTFKVWDKSSATEYISPNVLLTAGNPLGSFTPAESPPIWTNDIGYVLNIEVLADVHPPVAADQSVTTTEDVALAVTVSATDVDGDPVTYILVGPPANGTLTGTLPNITYTPNQDFTGADWFTFKANDGLADSNIATVSITVTAVNDAPVAASQTASTLEDTAIALVLTVSDPDADPLTYTVSTPAHGTLTGSPPNLTYTPDPGFNGVDSFTFQVNDGSVDSNIATFTLTITAVNDAPVASDQNLTTQEDISLAITLSATDADGDTLSYIVVSPLAAGVLSGTEANRTFDPPPETSGTYSFTFKANDGTVDSNTATVTITVTAVNDAPVAADQTITTYEDVAVAITLAATDIESNPLTYTLVTAPAHGTLTGTVPNLTYTPAPAYIGTDSFTFKANDGAADSGTATVTVSMVDNLPPTTPVPAGPTAEQVVAPGPVILQTDGVYADPEGDPHARSHWLIRRADGIYNQAGAPASYSTTSNTALTALTVAAGDLPAGLKYIWKVGYQDTGSNEISWSAESSFKVGVSQVDANVPAATAGTQLADFTMISFTQWPDNPECSAAFGITYDTKQYRIGTYDAGSGTYLECNAGLKIIPGLAYWLLARNGLTPTPQGVPTSTAEDIEVPLRYNNTSGNGWNQVAAPNNADYNWADVQVVEYAADGSIAFGPTAISALPYTNNYIDTRLWNWDAGTYDSAALRLLQYEGYWVQVKKANVSLKFPIAAQIAAMTPGKRSLLRLARQSRRLLHRIGLAPAIAIAASSAGPPLPIGGLNNGGGNSGGFAIGPGGGGGGCFISSALD